MAWQTPKLNWTPADGVRDTDFNRIEGNLLELYNTDAVRAARTIYVSTSGNDSSGNGSQNQPYRTIGKALSVLPKNLNGMTVTISIGTGTYAEDVVVDGFSNGVLDFTGSGTATLQSLTVSGGSTLQISLLSIATTTTGTGVFVTEGSKLIDLSNITCTGAGTGVRVANCGKAYIGGTLTINNNGTGLAVDSNGSAFVSQLAGSGSRTAMTASAGGVIAYGSNAATITSAIMATSTGGRINTGSQTGSGGGGVL